MTTEHLAIQRQYDEVIAPHYDQDPQGLLGKSLVQAIAQLRTQGLLRPGTPIDVLDVGVGTGLFLEKLQAAADGQAKLFGLDLSAQMVAIAQQRVPGLQVAVDDAVNLGAHFPGRMFDLICTHFITGFVPMAVLAPIIRSRLKPGGCWSLVGGTKAGFPALRAEADRDVVRRAVGGKRLQVEDITCNPAGRDDVVSTLTANGFAIAAAETFEPELKFEDVDDFLAFGYRGGWLTPFVEALGLHRAGRMKRMLINLLCFPIEDHHNIEIVLARKTDN